MDHDQRFKALIRDFFADFLVLFFRPWAERFDLSSVTWLDKELLPDPPEGARHLLDLVAQVRTRQPADGHPAEPDRWLALVHVEIEAPDQTTRLKPRLPYYYLHLRERHACPVLPVVLYLKVGLDGIGVDVYAEQFWELTPLRFEYLYVGLPGLDALQYVQGDNWLGVALSALMRIPPDRVAWLGAEALRRLAEAPVTEQQRFQLAECVEAYLPLTDEQRREYERMVSGSPHSGLRAMNKTTFEKGLERGQYLGLVRAAESLLRNKFGAVSEATRNYLQTYSEQQLDDLLPRIMTASSIQELGLPE